MTSLVNPLTAAENLYNESLIKKKFWIVLVYGKRRFPCLLVELRVKLKTALNIIVAIAIVHNIALNMHIEEIYNGFIEDLNGTMKPI